MKNTFKTFINCLCLLPFIGLLGGVLVLDEHVTDGTGAGKTVAFYAIMGLIPLATSLSYWNNRQSLKYCTTDWLVPLFAALGLAITYLNHPVWNTKMVSLVLLVVLYFSLRIFLVQHKANLHVLLLAFMGTGLVEALWGLLQLYGQVPSQHVLFRVTGSFFNPGPYAGYLAMILPMAVYYAIRDSKVIHAPFRRRMRYYYLRWELALSTLIGIVLILPATMSRAAWIAGGIGGIVVILSHLSKHKKHLIGAYLSLYTKKGIVVLATAALVIGIGLVGLYHLKKDSADGRALIWKVSMDIIEEQWLGVGLGYFSGRYGEAQGKYFASGRATEPEKFIAGEPEYAFNEFIQIAVELGVLPFLLLLIVFSYACVVGVRRGKLAVVASLGSLLVFSSMSYPFSLLPFLVALTLLITGCVSVSYQFTYINDFRNMYLFDYRLRRRWNSAAIIISLLASWVVVAYCLSNRYPVYLAHKQWSQARIYYHANAYEEAVKRYRGLLPHLGDQVHYLFEYSQALSKTARYEESIEVIDQATWISGDPMLFVIQGKNFMGMHDYRYADIYFKRAAQRVPHRLYPYYMMAKAYQEAGDLDKAKRMATHVLAKQVKVDSPATREMKAEMTAMIDSMEIENTTIEPVNDDE
ncbi:O-antigen ligase family protein [Parapedobacter koreensis]|uniref:O-antigen ligase n=1 Tax=Parapedobacter koreensis TaxID=332977 RepID=A0A1H7F3Q3_9SPHI|nr:O-antigen ligase family protein [Parapedobacter koreensis]SEK20007.1 O-antigen ligase [Parapedobacter koreensis]